MAAGQVGKVGVPICYIADLEALFAEIPLATGILNLRNCQHCWMLY